MFHRRFVPGLILLAMALAFAGCLFGGSDDPSPPAAPEVLGITPEGGAIHVETWSDVHLRFSTAMDEASVEAAISVTTQLRENLPFTVFWMGNVANIEFDSDLAHETTFTVTVGISAESSAGEPLAEPFVSSFTTLPTRPVVLSTLPADGATGVSLNVDPRISFSEWMNEVSTFTGLTVDPAVLFAASFENRELILDIQDDLTASTTYTITVPGTAQAIFGGETLGEDYVFSFNTGSGPDLEGPSIVSFDPPDGATGVSRDIGEITVTFSEPVVQWAIIESLDLRLEGLVYESPTMNDERTVLTLPLLRLPPGVELSIDFGALTDLAGNVGDNPPEYSFTVGGVADLHPAADGDWWLYWEQDDWGNASYLTRAENFSGGAFDMASYSSDRIPDEYTILEHVSRYTRSGTELTLISQWDGSDDPVVFSPAVTWLRFPLTAGRSWSGLTGGEFDGNSARITYTGEVLSITDYYIEDHLRDERPGWRLGRDRDITGYYPDCAEVRLDWEIEIFDGDSWQPAEEGTDISYYCEGVGLVYRHSTTLEEGGVEPEETHTHLSWWLVGQ